MYPIYVAEASSSASASHTAPTAATATRRNVPDKDGNVVPEIAITQATKNTTDPMTSPGASSDSDVAHEEHPKTSNVKKAGKKTTAANSASKLLR